MRRPRQCNLCHQLHSSSWAGHSRLRPAAARGAPSGAWSHPGRTTSSARVTSCALQSHSSENGALGPGAAHPPAPPPWALVPACTSSPAVAPRGPLPGGVDFLALKEKHLQTGTAIIFQAKHFKKRQPSHRFFLSGLAVTFASAFVHQAQTATRFMKEPDIKLSSKALQQSCIVPHLLWSLRFCERHLWEHRLASHHLLKLQDQFLPTKLMSLFNVKKPVAVEVCSKHPLTM
ncbi:hypothetical protein NDU88_005732 [Pleurodeles waltl]|uniref:Uncharacterized protein n=1 Tax=Pleurodeles waltl TaxID=8319 RepID=A0AAV7L255_PLEWA|nr:hypothetical protein NDU88_005732 [Pleurodeles waltl]